MSFSCNRLATSPLPLFSLFLFSSFSLRCHFSFSFSISLATETDYQTQNPCVHNKQSERHFTLFYRLLVTLCAYVFNFSPVPPESLIRLLRTLAVVNDPMEEIEVCVKSRTRGLIHAHDRAVYT